MIEEDSNMEMLFLTSNKSQLGLICVHCFYPERIVILQVLLGFWWKYSLDDIIGYIFYFPSLRSLISYFSFKNAIATYSVHMCQTMA